MSARNAVVAVAVLIAAAVGVAVFIGRGSTTEPGEVTQLRAASSFELPGLRPGEDDVSVGGRSGTPTVVNFFAAWCDPCRDELPALRDAATAYPGVTFVGVDHQDSRDDAVEILEQYGVAYAAGYDPRGDVAARYGIRGLPATVFIDSDGRIVELHQGALTKKALEERLRTLTSQTPAA